MSKWIYKTDVDKSDFLLKNWGIYHLHLEKISGIKSRFTKPNLLFFQVKGQVAHFIDVRHHPKGEKWFDRELFEIIYTNWPWLLVFMNGVKLLLDIPDNKIHKATKRMNICVDFKGRVMMPSNKGVMSSGNSAKAVMEANRIFNSIIKSELYIKEHEREIVNIIKKETGIKIKNLQNLVLRVDKKCVFAYEKESQYRIILFYL